MTIPGKCLRCGGRGQNCVCDLHRSESVTDYQTVTITLSDGRKGTFTGPALVVEADQGKEVIRDIQFGYPKQLPAGAKFEKIGE